MWPFEPYVEPNWRDHLETERLASEHTETASALSKGWEACASKCQARARHPRGAGALS